MTADAAVRRVLVANRGEIAVRIIRACHDEGLDAIIVVSDADADSSGARQADGTVHIGPSSPADSYLRVEQIVAAAILAGCDAIHPGYGFLSERPELAEACAEHGIVFVGPSAETIRRGGDKIAARAAARTAGVPTGDGTEAVSDADHVRSIAASIGYPVLLKAAAGGGGRCMVRLDTPDDVDERFALASGEAAAAFGDGRLYLERFVERGRHVEVQILADAHGNIVHLGDRDCSVQRRYQKMVEEAPASSIGRDLRDRMATAAIDLARELDYVGAGTVEFLVDVDRNACSFLEINTRVQVEHPVTEMVTGIDIVREQLNIAAGRPLSFGQSDVHVDGHAIECRINAESPALGFLPSPGRIDRWSPPDGPGVRVDTHVVEGADIPPFYDSLLAKVIVHGRDRPAAIDAMLDALDRFDIAGVDTTLDVQRSIIDHADFRSDDVATSWLETVALPDPVTN